MQRDRYTQTRDFKHLYTAEAATVAIPTTTARFVFSGKSCVSLLASDVAVRPWQLRQQGRWLVWRRRAKQTSRWKNVRTFRQPAEKGNEGPNMDSGRTRTQALRVRRIRHRNILLFIRRFLCRWKKWSTQDNRREERPTEKRQNQSVSIVVVQWR